MLSHLIFLSTDFFSKTIRFTTIIKIIKISAIEIINIFARREMIEAPMTSGTPYTHINVTYTHVLRGCGKVLADQLNFHDGGETRHYGATYHDKRGRDGLGYCYVWYWIIDECRVFGYSCVSGKRQHYVRWTNERIPSYCSVTFSAAQWPFFTDRLE